MLLWQIKVVQHDMNTTPLGRSVGLLSGINFEVYLPTDEKMCRTAGQLPDSKKEFIIMSERSPTGDLFVSSPGRRQRFMRAV